MLKIGDFSKLCRVTVKALRYYDEQNILKPDVIDPMTGYRYYSTRQLLRVSEIIRYKSMGFSLDEIRFIIKNALSPGVLYEKLEEQKNILQNQINSGMVKLLKVENLMKSMMEEKFMEQCVIKELPEVIVASMRKVIASYNELNVLAPEMGKRMKQQNAVCRDPAYCFNIYHDREYRETDIDVEVCEAVTKKLPDRDGIIYRKIQGVPEAACLYHKGPYSELGRSYGVILEWIETHGYQITDNPRESYIDGCWNKEDDADWLTEIQIPVGKID